MKELTFFSLILFASCDLLACFCVTPEFDECVERADVVFKGTVTKIMDNYEYSDTAYCYYCWSETIEFEVESIQKGDIGVSCGKILLLQGSSNCSFLFSQDSTYIVFGSFVKEPVIESNLPFIMTHQCSGTSKIKSSKMNRLFLKKDEEEMSVSKRLMKSCQENKILLLSIIFNSLFMAYFISQKWNFRSRSR